MWRMSSMFTWDKHAHIHTITLSVGLLYSQRLVVDRRTFHQNTGLQYNLKSKYRTCYEHSDTETGLQVCVCVCVCV